MKIMIPLSFIFLVYTSCSVYQYGTIGSTGLHLNEKNEFVAENDSLRIQYNFSGEDAPVKLMIWNKLDKPIYVDWQHSALVVNNKSISYSDKPVYIDGTISRPGSSTSARSLIATASLPE